LQIGAIFALASISFKWVEAPLRAHNWGKGNPAFIGFIVSAASSIALSLLVLNPAFSLFSGKREGVLKKEQPLLEEYAIPGTV
jgi:hypothetical protein